MSKFLWCFLLLISCGTSHKYDSQIDSTATFSSDYGLSDLYSKATNYDGKGLAQLQGTRNFRLVLKDTMYRGGKINAKGNINPMTAEGLNNLCKEGFTTAVYLYSTNYKDAPKQVICGNNKLDYLQLDPKYKAKELLTVIFNTINKGEKTYEHCWNGWHNSGLISAYSLMQFCGWSNTNALAYWKKNVDGNDGSAYSSLHKRILDFKVYPDLVISAEKQKQLCIME